MAPVPKSLTKMQQKQFLFPQSLLHQVRSYLGPNTLGHWFKNKKSSSNSSALFFTSNEAIFKCQGHLKIELNLLERVSGTLATIWVN